MNETIHSDETTFGGNEVIQPAILHQRHLGFHYLLKSQEIKEINTESSQNAYEMYKFVNVYNLMKKTGKKTQNYLKKGDFWSNLHGI